MTNTNNEVTHPERFSVGDRVKYLGKWWTIVRVAKPIRFDIGVWPDRHIEVMPAYDLIEGDDVDSFEADFRPGIQQDVLRLA